MTLAQCHISKVKVSAHIAQIGVQAITHYHVGFGYFTQLLFTTQGNVMTLTQGHIFKVKVIMHTANINGLAITRSHTRQLDLDNTESVFQKLLGMGYKTITTVNQTPFYILDSVCDNRKLRKITLRRLLQVPVTPS